MKAPINRVSEDYKDEAWLRSKYTAEGLSRKQIGDICGVNENTVRYYMNKYAISSRKGKDKMTPAIKTHLSNANIGRTPWNAGMSGSYQKWTKSGENAPGYRGGVVELTFDGLTYRKILRQHHPYSDANGYVFEHRLVCEKLLGRYLFPEEVVHHRDGDSLNNAPSNLFVFKTNSDHMRFHHAKRRNPHLTEEEFCYDTKCEYSALRAA